MYGWHKRHPGSMKEKRTEFLVGVFLFIGLSVLGGLILNFGNFQERFRKTYLLTITFDDGGGLVKGADVRLSGVKIGRVADRPRMNPDSYGGAIVDLEIFDEFQIPVDSAFTIGTKGLLGDSLIEIKTPAKRAEGFIEPGTTLEGQTATGFSALASSAENLSQKGQDVLEDVREALGDLGSAIGKLDQNILREETLKRFDTAMTEMTSALEGVNQRILTDDNTENLRELLKNLRDASGKLDEAAVKLGPILDEGEEVVASLEPGLKRLFSAAEGAEVAFEKLNSGSGLLAALLEDQELKEEVQLFVSNLRRSGILRYKDSSESGETTATGANQGGRRRGLFNR